MISLIIPTKNRKTELTVCLKSVYNSNRKPDEIIIIDDGGNYDINDVLNNFNELNIKLIRNEVSGGPANTRNQGVAHSTGDIIFFLDDDCEVFPDYFSEIEKIYADDKNKKIGGVEGLVINSEKNFYTNETKLRKYFNIIFMQIRVGKKSFMQPSAFPVISNETSATIEVKSLCGSSTYRKKVFNEFKYEPLFRGWSFDDHEFAYRVSKKYKLIHHPKAKMYHHHTTTARESIYELRKKRIWQHYIIWRKTMPFTPFHFFCFLWSNFGIFLESIYLHRWTGFKAALAGYKKMFSLIKNGNAD